jgi:hypothetical protein
MPYEEQLKGKNKLVGRRVGTTPPRIEDIDPWGWDRNPCTGQRYDDFRAGVSRREIAFMATQTDRHGERWSPSKKRMNAMAAKVKRERWQEDLHNCAMRVYLNRARVSKNPAVRAVAEDFGVDTDFDPNDFAGLGRTRKKGTKRCAKAPKKITKACSEEAYRKNLRHLICVGGKHPAQAKAIAASVLKGGCGVTKTTKRGIAEIVKAGKRKKARKRAKPKGRSR